MVYIEFCNLHCAGYADSHILLPFWLLQYSDIFPLYIEHSLQSPINRLFVDLLGSFNSAMSCLNAVFFSCSQFILLFFSIFYFSILFFDISHSCPSILSHSFSLLNPAFWPSTPYMFLASLVSLSPLTH